MPAPRSSEAERFAKARQEFAEAMERGCTIPQLRELKARERWAAAEKRLADSRTRCGTEFRREEDHSDRDIDEKPQPWWTKY